MKIIIVVSAFLFTSLFFVSSGMPANQPTFINLKSDYELVSKSEKAFTFKNPDTLLSHDMFLLKSEDDLPLMYYADIQTPVCIDNLCKPVFIEMYWDLFGNYIGYGEFPDERLSKFDHDNFEEADYLKLHDLLSDAHSILGKRPLDKLYDISQSRDLTIKFKGVEVDGVSGATRKEIKTEIVDGALYSCHKLWRLAYGSAVSNIKNNISSIFSDRLSDHLLRSDHRAYHSYTLEQLSKDQMKEKIEPIVQVFKSATALTRKYILKKLPNELFAHHAVVTDICGSFESYDNNSKTLIVSNLQYSTPASILSLSGQISSMSKNQLKIYLNQLASFDHLKSDELTSRLSDTSLSEEYPYYYLIAEYLRIK